MARVGIAPGQPHAFPLRQRFAPVRLVGTHSDDVRGSPGAEIGNRAVGSRLGRQLGDVAINRVDQKLNMVTVCGQRQFMHEALRGKDLNTIARRSPSAGRNSQWKHRGAATQVRRLDGVFDILGKPRGRSFLLSVRSEGDEMLLPGVEPAIFINRSLELVITGGAKKSWLKSSSRLHCSLTGASTLRAMAAASQV